MKEGIIAVCMAPSATIFADNTRPSRFTVGYEEATTRRPLQDYFRWHCLRATAKGSRDCHAKGSRIHLERRLPLLLEALCGSFAYHEKNTPMMKLIVFVALAAVFLGTAGNLCAQTGKDAPSVWDSSWPVERKLHTIVSLQQGLTVSLAILSETRMGRYLDYIPDKKGFIQTYVSYIPAISEKFLRFSFSFMDDYFANHEDPKMNEAFAALILRWHDTTQ